MNREDRRDSNSDSGAELDDGSSESSSGVTGTAEQTMDDFDDPVDDDPMRNDNLLAHRRDLDNAGAAGGEGPSSTNEGSESAGTNDTEQSPDETDGDMYDDYEGGPDDETKILVVECRGGLSYRALYDLLASGQLLRIIHKLQIHNRHFFLLNKSDDSSMKQLVSSSDGEFEAYEYLRNMLDGHDKLVAMVEVPPGIEYNCAGVDLCYFLKKSLQPVFGTMLAPQILERCEIKLRDEDKPWGSRDIHIDLTPQELEVMRTSYVEKGLVYRPFDRTQEDVTVRFKLESHGSCNNSLCEVNFSIDASDQENTRDEQTPECPKKVPNVLKSEILKTRIAALRDTSSDNREAEIDEIIQQEPLTMEHIQTLDQYVSHYVIPFNQTEVKRHALIFFTKTDRAGATKEADNMYDTLDAAGFAVIKNEWTRMHHLLHMINDQKKIADKCSLLVVFLMTHGCDGFIRGPGGETIPINDILIQLDLLAANHIPKVIIIQSCRKRTSMLPYSALATSGNHTHIALTKPNTVLLSATVSGGKAYRGAFTGAFSDQIRKADGKTDIHVMFLQSYLWLHREHQTQTPVFQSTLRKNLFLPPISDKMANNTALIPIHGEE